MPIFLGGLFTGCRFDFNSKITVVTTVRLLIVRFDVRINRISRMSLGQTQARGRNMAVRDHVCTQSIHRSPHALARAVSN